VLYAPILFPVVACHHGRDRPCQGLGRPNDWRSGPIRPHGIDPMRKRAIIHPAPVATAKSSTPWGTRRKEEFRRCICIRKQLARVSSYGDRRCNRGDSRGRRGVGMAEAAEHRLIIVDALATQPLRLRGLSPEKTNAYPGRRSQVAPAQEGRPDDAVGA